MNPAFWVLVGLGGLIIVAGIALMFRGGPEGSTELDFLGAKIKTTHAGVAMIVIGVAMIVPSARKLAEGPQLRVTDVALSTDATMLNVRCPVPLDFVGNISATGQGTVSYRFVTAQGTSGSKTQGRLETVEFAESGTKRVEHEVVANIPEGDISYTVQLEVVEPGRERSAPVTVSVRCDPALPPGPPSRPPDVPGGPPG